MPLDIIPPGILLDISVIILLATVFAYLARFLKQPLIPAYIIAGLLLGPIGLGFIKDPEVIKNLSEIGIAFLLFIVGLEIDLKKLKKVGLIASAGGFIQVGITFFFGLGIAMLLGFSKYESAVVGLVLAFSSTMIVIKLLSDKEELATLHGRIIIGILLMQDILVILALTMLQTAPLVSLSAYFWILVKGIVLFGLAFLINQLLIKPIFKFAAKSQEVLFLSSIATCFLFSMLALVLGFSIAIGAFIGGVVLANLPYHFDIIARIKPLRDFFATIFFVSLGMQVAMFDVFKIIIPLLVFLAVVLLIKPFILLAIVNFFGYGKRASFITALNLAQISEFSLILVILLKDKISPELFSITIIIGIVTIALTAYLVKYDEWLYNRLAKYLALFEKYPSKFDRLSYGRRAKYEIILFGCHRMGSIILETFKRHKHKVFVVDFNPEAIDRLMSKKINCMYGDISNMEILHKVNFKDAKIAVSTIPFEEDNLILIKHAKKVNPNLKVFVTANHLHEALNLYEEGADYVILPPIVSGERVSSFLEKIVDNKAELMKLRRDHLKHLLMLNAEK